MYKKAFLVVPFVLCLFTAQAFSQKVLKVGSAAPQFTGTSSDGVQYDLSALKGKVVVLTFWSTSCEICRVELPRLDQFVRRYDQSQVLFLAMTAENDDVLRNYLRSHPFRFKTIANSFGTLLQYADRDRTGSLMMQYPSFYVISTDGRLAYRGSGYGKTDALDAAVRQQIASR